MRAFNLQIALFELSPDISSNAEFAKGMRARKGSALIVEDGAEANAALVITRCPSDQSPQHTRDSFFDALSPAPMNIGHCIKQRQQRK
jgi:hypothetical protein